MSDPFFIEGPAILSISGGRTSGYMLWRILQAHSGKLPDDVRVIFANTGKEMPETLDFVRDMGERWGVPFTWVEYRTKTAEGKNHAIVDWNTASRQGEPYAALIEDRKYLPNPFARFCTSELKVRPMHRIIRGWGWDSWIVCVGIRADEPRRIARIRARPSDETNDETRCMPLVDGGVAVGEVMAFWKAQDFDLKLPVNAQGNTTHGNCDLCFLKKHDHLLSMIREEPRRALWWIEQEKKVTAIGSARKDSGARFRMDRPSYAKLHEIALSQGEMFDYGDEPLQDCMCVD